LDRLTELFVDRGVPQYIRSDHGAEFTARAVRDWLQVLARISHTPSTASAP